MDSLSTFNQNKIEAFVNIFHLLIWTVLVMSFPASGKVKVTFDEKPDFGIPVAAQLQDFKHGDAKLWGELFADKIESASIRYFDADIWKSEEQVGKYLQGFLKRKDMKVFNYPFWAQGVGIPEIECTVKFNDEYRKSSERKFKYGKILIWNTVACFRDANGIWHFLSNGKHFYLHHPKRNNEIKADLEKRRENK